MWGGEVGDQRLSISAGVGVPVILEREKRLNWNEERGWNDDGGSAIRMYICTWWSTVS
jgi:hypothetical protein